MAELSDSMGKALGKRRSHVVEGNVISADSHMFEPPNLWEERIDKAFKDKAPKVVFDEGKRGLFLLIHGIAPKNVITSIAVGKKPEEYKEFFQKGLEAARPGGWDPEERLKDMDIDGVDAAVLYTSHGRWMFMIEDVAYQEACFKTYNDWIAEFCSHNPKRFIGIALVSLYNVENAAKELARCRKMGLRGALIWGAHLLDSREYDPFWAEAEALEMPLTVHATSGSDRGAGAKQRDHKIWNNALGHISKPNQAECSLTVLIFSGVMERYPRLKFVAAEYDIGWIPYFLQHADALHRRWSPMSGIKLSMLPSEYFRRQVYVTFIRDPIGLQMVSASLLEADNAMWCDDYPHGASTWPHSREVIAKNMAGLSEEDRRKIIKDNAASLYNIELE